MISYRKVSVRKAVSYKKPTRQRISYTKSQPISYKKGLR